MDRAGLAVLRELWAWRDATARQRDKPHFRVLRDETLLALAKTPPASIGDLTRIQGFPDSIVRSPAALDIVDAARRGVACAHELRADADQGIVLEHADDDRPALRTDVREKLEPAVVARVARIREQRDRLAHELALDPSVLASRATVEEMAKRWEAGEDPWAFAELRMWQIGVLRPALS